jgi:acylphosphatase
VGEVGSVERFIERLREGAPASEVAQVVTVEAPVEELHGFMRRQSERQAEG